MISLHMGSKFKALKILSFLWQEIWNKNGLGLSQQRDWSTIKLLSKQNSIRVLKMYHYQALKVLKSFKKREKSKANKIKRNNNNRLQKKIASNK